MRDYTYDNHVVHVDPPAGERRFHILQSLTIYAIVVIAICALISWAVGIRDNYLTMTKARIAAERRADAAEKQLAVMLSNGDGGVLLATIKTEDMGLAEIRIMPRRK